MEKGFDCIKSTVVNLKLDWCCWLAPVRIGLLITGYFNIILAVISIVGIADSGFAPILVQVQDSILEDNAKALVPIVAYASELAFNVILLSALYRNDVALMRVYMKYCIAALIASVMFYSMVMAAIGVLTAIAMVFSILFQLYVLILVRSIIVEMRLHKKNLELPTLVMSSIIPEAKEKTDEEAPEESENSEVHAPDRLETVDEHPKEETINEKE